MDVINNRYVLSFSLKGMQRIQWESSKRFLNCSLLCLSHDNFASILLFTVKERNVGLLSQGKIAVAYHGDISLLKKEKRPYVMAESSVYFEAYRGVLEALQQISPSDFPLSDFILCRNIDPVLPDYLLHQEPVYNLRPLVEPTLSCRGQMEGMGYTVYSTVSDYISRVPILDVDERPKPEELGLDPAQMEALFAALTQKVVVIQGPPGTGKTYLGLRIVQLLLHNKSYWWTRADARPILIVCYTNHALDQFLEEIMKVTQKIVRIGGQSKCDSMKQFSLIEWRRKSPLATWRNSRKHSRMIDLRREMSVISSEFTVTDKIIKKVASGGIVHESTLVEFQVISKEMHTKFRQMKDNVKLECDQVFMNRGSILPVWLGIHSKGDVDGVLEFFQHKPTIHEPEEEKQVLQAEEEVENDDQWDKEDVDEAQGERETEDNDPVVGYLAAETKASSIENSKIQFGFSLGAFSEEIKRVAELGQSDADNQPYYEDIATQLQSHLIKVRELLKFPLEADRTHVMGLYDHNLNDIPLPQRWFMYAMWRTMLLRDLNKKLKKLSEDFESKLVRYKSLQSLENAEICKAAYIVGITTTGAAKQQSLLNCLQPKIVLVEEAAEVLEAHITVSLSKECQHLILIGDHKQLRPPTTVYHLAKDYHLDVSLFERLIMNGMKPYTLQVQHRMRPEIARLIVPAIYPGLQNHHSVMKYPRIRGMKHNVFFLTHKINENAEHEGRSHSNPFEAEMALALAKHLLMQGYTANQLTILTTYSGQLLHLKMLRKKEHILKDVRITVVDNFQGEENDIIILSLVRSNIEENIGFLRIENRICVALSRAKQGFYLIGNMEALQGKGKWGDINKVLEANKEIGKQFTLVCEMHGTITKVSNAEEFPLEGGCDRRCETLMQCKHICPRLCHTIDREHTDTKCIEACNRFCENGHPCPKNCWENCKPCTTIVSRELPCKHVADMKCYEDPTDFFCSFQLVKKLPNCHHEIKMDCSRSLETVKCPKKCGMLLECGHNCKFPCHNRSSHESFPCKQPCQRSPCSEKHKCPKLCYEPCGDCQVEVNKTLPCLHEATLKCFENPQKAYCSVEVPKALSKCEHTALLKCSASSEGYICKERCQRLCPEGHACEKLCHQPCGLCKVPVERLLSRCGHTMKAPCHLEESKIFCTFPCQKTLPACGHKVAVRCGDVLDQVSCPLPCDIRLDCGHSCAEKCHVKTDPNHTTYKCKKRCERGNKGCKLNHKCSKRCFEECDPCQIEWERTLKCGHKYVTKCFVDDEDVFCKKKVKKVIPECGHSVTLECSTEPTVQHCKEYCERILDCNHKCAKLCRELCNSSDCVEIVTLPWENSCGHPIRLECNRYRKEGIKVLNDDDKEELLGRCLEPCDVLLPCEHFCRGNCGNCFNGRLHQPCGEKCGRTFVCGHNCEVNCAMSCPPCNKRCEYRCVHSKCNRKCCEPCTQCQEMCQWRCEHHRCSRKCWEICDRPYCNEPCKRKLKCGHLCIGLCGEECPPLCRVCDRTELTEFILYGNEEDEDSRFVYLPDCGHCIEVEGMDYWMSECDKGEIQMKTCPRCKTIIQFCPRYGNILKKVFQDITAVKNKLNLQDDLHGFMETVNARSRNMLDKIQSVKLQGNVSFIPKIKEMLNKNSVILNDRLTTKHRKPLFLSSDQRYLIEVSVELTKQIVDLLVKATNPIKTTNQSSIDRFSGSQSGLHILMNCQLIEKFGLKCEKLFDSLVFRHHRIAEYEYEAFRDEIERLNYIMAYYAFKSLPQFNHTSTITFLANKREIEEKLIWTVKKLDEESKHSIKQLLENFGHQLNTGLGISDVERQQIVAALGMKQGHWFKCPNGHIYVITECGGAMQVGRCNECGAAIGGSNHALRSDNRLASEMDGARYSAWSQQNNMGNFDMNDLL